MRRRHTHSVPEAPFPGARRPPGRVVRVLAWTVLAAAIAWSSPNVATAATCWRPPVNGVIVDPFRAPDCPYCAGHRGVEYRVVGAAPVRSVEAGVVTFSGAVAGTSYVVVEHVNRWMVTYGGLGDVRVVTGQRVVRGAVLGTAHGWFHFGLRVGGEYRDPEPFLGRPVGRARLVPIDGTLRRRAPSARWVCVPVEGLRSDEVATRGARAGRR